MKVYYFSEFPYHEYPDEEAEKHPSIRLTFPTASLIRRRPTSCSSATSTSASMSTSWATTGSWSTSTTAPRRA